MYWIKKISNFHFLSIRERDMAQCVKANIEKDVYHSCDPTLLLTREDWDLFAGKRNNEKYIFTALLEKGTFTTALQPVLS